MENPNPWTEFSEQNRPPFEQRVQWLINGMEITGKLREKVIGADSPIVEDDYARFHRAVNCSWRSAPPPKPRNPCLLCGADLGSDLQAMQVRVCPSCGQRHRGDQEGLGDYSIYPTEEQLKLLLEFNKARREIPGTVKNVTSSVCHGDKPGYCAAELRVFFQAL